MIEAAVTVLSALIGGALGSFATFFFALRQDKVSRRRERTISHLIEAYRNLENASQRHPLSDEQKDRIESSLAAIFLLGSKRAASAASVAAASVGEGRGDFNNLLKSLRADLRDELGLESHDVQPVFLRFERDKELRN